MTKAELIALLEGVPDDTKIIIHCPEPSRVLYPSINSLDRRDYFQRMDVDGVLFPPVLTLKGCE